MMLCSRTDVREDKELVILQEGGVRLVASISNLLLPTSCRMLEGVSLVTILQKTQLLDILEETVGIQALVRKTALGMEDK